MNFENGLPMPYSEEAEKTILGAILKSPDVFNTILMTINADKFYVDGHRKLFLIMYELFVVSEKIDVMTVTVEAVRNKLFESDTEAYSFLEVISDSVPTVANIDSYCKIVNEFHLLRELTQISKGIIDDITENVSTADEILDSAEQKFFNLRQGKEVGSLLHIRQLAIDAYQHIWSRFNPETRAQNIGLSSGFINLDAVTTGLNKSDLLILAARPGMGKTAFALNLITNVAKNSGKSCALFSLEMSSEQVLIRLFSTVALVNSSSLRAGNFDPNDWEPLATALNYIGDLPVYIDDAGGITVPQMKAKLRRIKDLGFVVIDYLGLITSTMKNANTVTILSDMTRQLKLMAKDLNVPVMVLSQLSRNVEHREDKRPNLADLRDSGSIEQDADIVLFLYREGYYNKACDDPTLAECIIAKNRHGETGKILLRWDGEHTRFSMPTNILPP